jgi:hypothetical protein
MISFSKTDPFRHFGLRATLFDANPGILVPAFEGDALVGLEITDNATSVDRCLRHL